jgi:hypothetical protein
MPLLEQTTPTWFWVHSRHRKRVVVPTLEIPMQARWKERKHGPSQWMRLCSPSHTEQMKSCWTCVHQKHEGKQESDGDKHVLSATMQRYTRTTAAYRHHRAFPALDAAGVHRGIVQFFQERAATSPGWTRGRRRTIVRISCGIAVRYRRGCTGRPRLARHHSIRHCLCAARTCWGRVTPLRLHAACRIHCRVHLDTRRIRPHRHLCPQNHTTNALWRNSNPNVRRRRKGKPRAYQRRKLRHLISHHGGVMMRARGHPGNHGAARN